MSPAQEILSSPFGFSKVTVAAAESEGQSRLTAISANFLREEKVSTLATLIDDYSDGYQSVVVSGADWASNEFLASPHLAYLTNAGGAEEAFLITGHTTDGQLTIHCGYDLRGDSETLETFGENVELVIRQAHTINSLFGSQVDEINRNDGFNLWSGKWVQYSYTGSMWVVAGDPFTDQGNTVIFPEEGLLIQRSQPTPLVFRFFGEVPTKVQTATLDAAGLHLISNRYPVSSTLAEQRIEQLAGWNSTQDSLYLWRNDSWKQFSHDGTAWRAAGNPFEDAGGTIIPPNSALFISRATATPTNTRQIPDYLSSEQ